MPDDEPDYDYWQEYKDDLAMGRIWPDGTYREPEYYEEPYEDDWAADLAAQWVSR